MNAENWKQFKNFKPEEFDSPDKPGSGMEMSYAFLTFLQAMRDGIGIPLVITPGGGFRTNEYQAKQGSTSDVSDHTEGEGVDIRCADANTRFGILRWFFQHCDKYGVTRVGVYDKHIHFGMCPKLPQEVSWVGQSK